MEYAYKKGQSQEHQLENFAYSSLYTDARQKLRAQVGIAREAVVRGVGSYMEIWERETYNRYDQQYRPSYEAGSLAAGGTERSGR